MAEKIKNTFISHVHEDDEGLVNFKNLLKKNGMMTRDYSIRSDNPNNAHDENYIKYQILAPRIRQCSALAVYISPDTRYSPWVNWEIEYAHKCGKTIVGAYENGAAGCKLPEALESYGDAVVGWRGDDIISAIDGRLSEWRGPNEETSSATGHRTVRVSLTHRAFIRCACTPTWSRVTMALRRIPFSGSVPSPPASPRFENARKSGTGWWVPEASAKGGTAAWYSR